MRSDQERPLFNFTPDERLDYEATLLRITVVAEIQGYLDHANLQAKDLAKRVGKSKSWISKLLSGRQNPTLDTLAETAWALGARWEIELRAVDRLGTPAAGDAGPPLWATGDQVSIYQIRPQLFAPPVDNGGTFVRFFDSTGTASSSAGRLINNSWSSEISLGQNRRVTDGNSKNIFQESLTFQAYTNTEVSL